MYHAFEPFTDSGGVDHVYAYGSPNSTFEYAFRAQLAAVRQYQAIYEGFAEFMWQFYSAIILVCSIYIYIHIYIYIYIYYIYIYTLLYIYIFFIL